MKAFCDKYSCLTDKVLENEGTDYRFRIFVSRGEFANIVAKEALNIDYTNYKNAVHAEKAQSKSFQRYLYHDAEEEALFHVWSAMANYQLEEEMREGKYIRGVDYNRMWIDELSKSIDEEVMNVGCVRGKKSKKKVKK